MAAEGRRPCPVCRWPDLPESGRFCPGCGAALDPLEGGAGRGAGPLAYTPEHLLREILVSRSALEGERKHVAVLLADVVESLAMAEALDPEDVHLLMQGLFEMALDIVHRHGGTLNQFRGDGFMALFGAPRTRGDECLRAVRAAAEIREAATGWSAATEKRFGVPLLLRMGVASGLVWVGSIGSTLRRDYTAEGATVGLAARIERLASPGQILLSEQVARSVSDRLPVRDLGEHSLRGVSSPVRVFEVLEAAPASEPPAPQSGAPALRGRKGDLERIERHLVTVGPDDASLVEVRGPAGIGKSRLLLELAKGAASLGSAWCIGFSLEADASRAHAAWLSLLEGWPRGSAGQEEARRLARELRAGRVGPAPGEVEDRARALLESGCEGSPRRIAFDDAQWMDPSSASLLAALLERPPRQGLAVMLAARDESPLLRSAPSSLRIVLRPLSEEDVRALVHALLAPEPHLVDLVVERSEGNPLFALELARSLREGPEALRAAARVEARWRQLEVRVPETIHGILAARIDALPDAAKHLLQTASVVGSGFDADLLRWIQPDEGLEEVEALLSELVGRDLLVRTPQGFDFSHVLCREVAYEQSLQSRRRMLHQRLAELLAARAPDDAPQAASIVGHHFLRAGMAERAARFLGRAGKIYLDRLALSEAASHLGRAWEALCGAEAADARLRVEVGLQLAAALNAGDRSGEAAAIIASLGPLADQELDRIFVADALVNQGWVLFTERDQWREGRALTESGLALAQGIAAGERVVGTAHAFLIRMHHLEGRIDQAVASAQRCAEVAVATGNRFARAFARGNEGYVICERGEVVRGHRLCEEAVVLAAEAEDRAALALTRAWLARACVYLGDAERALRTAEEAIEAAEAASQPSALYTAMRASGEAHLLLGEPRRAAKCFEALGKINERWTSTPMLLAVARLELGRYDGAIEVAEAGLARNPAALHRIGLLRVLALASALAKREGACDPEKLLREALSLADELRLRPHVAASLAALAELSLWRGDTDAAEYFLERATGVWTGCGMNAHAEAARVSLRAL